MQDLSLFGGQFEFQTWSKVKTPVGNIFQQVSSEYLLVVLSKKKSKIGNHNLHVFAVVF